MNFDYKIGDTVKVIRTGQTYSTHVGAVKELGGDYDPADYEHFKRTNKLGNPVRRRWISNKNYKFKILLEKYLRKRSATNKAQ